MISIKCMRSFNLSPCRKYDFYPGLFEKDKIKHARVQPIEVVCYLKVFR